MFEVNTFHPRTPLSRPVKVLQDECKYQATLRRKKFCPSSKKIAKSLTDEKIYPETYVTPVFDLKPSKSFIENVNGLLHKFHRKNDRDRFMKDYFGTMYRSWKEYFHPFSDQKVVFLMLVNLPERLITLILKESESLKSISGHTVCKFHLYKVHWVRSIFRRYKVHKVSLYFVYKKCISSIYKSALG